MDNEKNKQIKVFIDHREAHSGIAEKLREMGAEVEEKQLPIGDFIVSDRVCIERKRRADFEQSIIDGRLFEQAERLAATYEKPLMIIEGEKFEERIRREALLGAIGALMIDFGISVFFTIDAEKTAEFVLALARREQLGKKREARVHGSRRALTMEQHQRAVVEAFPGVGPQRARSLLREFKTIEKLMIASEEKIASVERVGEARAKLIRRVIQEYYCGTEEHRDSNKKN